MVLLLYRRFLTWCKTQSLLLSLILFIFGLVLFIFSFISFIFSLVLFIFSHLIYIQLSCMDSVTSLCMSHILHALSLILYLFSLIFLYSVSHIVCEDIMPQILSCSKFRKHQIELEIKKTYINTKIYKTEKNIVEKTQTWKTLQELYSF